MLLKIILLVIAIFQGIVIGFILLKSPFFKSKANQYLSYAIFTLSWSLIKMVLEIIELTQSFSYLKYIEIIDSELLFPAFIFLFIVHQLHHPLRYSKKLIWLFIPSLFSTLYLLGLSILQIQGETFQELNLAALLSIVFFVLLVLVILTYIPSVLYYTYKIILTSKSKKEKDWLLKLWYIEVFVLVVYILLIVVGPFILKQLSSAMQILALLATLVIHWIAYAGVYKLKLLNDQSSIRAFLSVKVNKHQKQKLEKKEVKKNTKETPYYLELERLCTEQKIYRDSTLDRNKVAEKLTISPSYLSQVISAVTNENFSTYINKYRVEEVKKLLLNNEFNNYSLLAIGLECGFSSKTTFYNAFKKHTGLTPNAYKKINKSQ